MSDCVNEVIGRKLHAFELGALNDAQREEFELHLYECDHCLAEVERFQTVARQLRRDPDVRELVARTAAAAMQTASRNRFLQLMVAVTAVLVIAFILLQRENRNREPQLLRLLPLRGTPANVIHLDRGGDVEFHFVLEGADENTSCWIAITSPDGRVIYTMPRFDDFNDKGLGILRLPVTRFRQGDYTLIITDLSDVAPLPAATYRFLAQ
jgi:hypothetical protein